jgi:hypothetical protein
MAQVIGAVPVADRVALYSIFIVPLGSVCVVIVGGTGVVDTV